MTVKEVAACFRVSRFLVDKMIREGVLPAIRFGKAIRVRRDHVDALINGPAQTTPPDKVAP